MAAAPTPDPSQQGGAPPQGGATQQQGAPQQGAPDAGGGAPSQAPAPPELMFLSAVQGKLKEFAQQYPPASAGIAKAAAGLTEAMSAMTVAQTQQQAPSQSPPY